jgi:hypothetical protein
MYKTVSGSKSCLFTGIVSHIAGSKTTTKLDNNTSLYRINNTSLYRLKRLVFMLWYFISILLCLIGSSYEYFVSNATISSSNFSKSVATAPHWDEFL